MYYCLLRSRTDRVLRFAATAPFRTSHRRGIVYILLYHIFVFIHRRDDGFSYRRPWFPFLSFIYQSIADDF